MREFMVEMDLPSVLTHTFMTLIPQQRQWVSDMFSQQKLVSYALAENRRKIWASFSIENEQALREELKEMPLAQFLHFRFYSLEFNEHIAYNQLPFISLN
ncbi:MAG: hypothetical protein R2798_12015 [Chitinophagales bacterium]|nr:hypothetical protein [Bacteroidota bacterium]MCB9043629.1 hypothetical protein [Chitinophagales bacterium]